MKNVMLSAAIAAFLMVGTTSCTKDYTCECTAITGNQTYHFTKLKKESAENQCNDKEVELKKSDSTANCSVK